MEDDGLSESSVIAVAVSGFAISILTTAALIMLVYRRKRWALYPHEPNGTVQMLRVRSSLSQSSQPSIASETQV